MGNKNRSGVLFGSVALIFLIATLGVSPALADGPNRVALVVVHDGDVVTKCVEFSEDEISGFEVLERSGLDLNYETNGMGAAICRLDGEGCTYPKQKCFCECQGSPCVYWSYWRSSGGDWEYSGMGTSNTQVSDGDMEGWVWGEGTTSSAESPPDIEYDDVCEPFTPTPEPTDTPPPTNTPTPTNTPEPTDTPKPTRTPTPTGTPEPTSTPEVSFKADATTLTAGSCTTLRWDVENVEEVYLDDQAQQGHSSKQVCPTANEAHTLRVVSGSKETTYQVSLVVTAAAQSQGAASTATPSPTLKPGTTPAAKPLPPSPTVAPVASTSSSAPPTVASTPTSTAKPRSLPSGTKAFTPTTRPPTAISQARATQQPWATRAKATSERKAAQSGFSSNSMMFLLFSLGSLGGVVALAAVFAVSWWWSKRKQ